MHSNEEPVQPKRNKYALKKKETTQYLLLLIVSMQAMQWYFRILKFIFPWWLIELNVFLCDNYHLDIIFCKISIQILCLFLTETSVFFLIDSKLLFIYLGYKSNLLIAVVSLVAEYRLCLQKLGLVGLVTPGRTCAIFLDQELNSCLLH